ncbi:acetyl esterase/lipase [Neisseria sp. HSC-16F19]|nr:subtype B tannase [Neisseria sp. HSC-16F19]MCP2040348.1 acetyl esterase/lipase [Neisseria sp. HSC-16F19]
MSRNIVLSTLALCLLAACNTPAQPESTDPQTQAAAAKHPVPQQLDFRRLQGVAQSFEIDGQTVHYRAFENIVYVQNPVDTRYQVMNIYIPEAYFHGGSVQGFDADSAPIFLPNQVGGYMPAAPGKPEPNTRNGNQPNAIMVALSQGFVVASPGARGRSDAGGRAPAAIVDLKAAVRYLHANDAAMPGRAERIISNGTSAGGALSALLGTSGNAPDFEPYLREAGAAPASDAVFAVSAYCPITNLEHADMAYEWQFNGVHDYQKISIQNIDYRVERKLVKGTQTAEQTALSDQLASQFPAYVNSLNLRDEIGRPLRLEADGSGSFKNYMNRRLLQSAQLALNEGTDIPEQDWLTVRGSRAYAADFHGYARFVGRQKTTPAFDAVDLSSGENNLFGDEATDKKHFTDFSMRHSTVPGARRADNGIVRLMNAMNYIGPDGTRHYRIRVGQNDRDTSLAISAILALKLQNHGKQVDYHIPWGVAHSGDYDLPELFAWARKISQEP